MTTALFGNRSLQVGTIFCLGRNYEAHAREMGASRPDAPVVFIKPSTAILHSGSNVVLPRFSKELHHEVEMVVLLGQGGINIPVSKAMSFVAGYGVGLDMTLRDIQARAKAQGLPWSVAKGFDSSAPISTIAPASEVPDPHSLSMSLRVNGVVRQQGSTANMIFRVEEIVAYLSTVFTLREGDVIFTGTPEGVGPVFPGDTLHAELDGVASLEVGIEVSAESES